MKKIILFIAFLLIAPLCLAQSLNDYNDYSSLKIAININNSFDIITKNPQIDFLSANLSFFPRTEGIQKVDSLVATTDPPNGIKPYDESEIPFLWQSPKASHYYLELSSIVSVTNSIITVDKKIDFPIAPIETQFTKPAEFVDMDEAIASKASELAEGEDDLYVVAFKVASWVESNIKYDLSTLTADVVQKSTWVMQNREGVCDEITNLYISMMRSLGIPARFASGLAYSNIGKKWGPHAWAEVYFPDKGWVPFDVTYKEFGWIDPTHIKLKTTLDSGDPSMQYLWRGRDIKINKTRINANAYLLETGNKIKANPVKMSLSLPAGNAGPASYMPIELTLENTQSFYVPETITITKAQKLEGSNVRAVLLKPNEVKKIHWVMELPKILDPNYVYTTIIEAEDIFHETASANLTYSSTGKVITKEESQSFIAEEPSKKTYTNGLVIQCSNDKYAYSYEDVFISCTARNLGNTALPNIKICLEKDCKITSLGIAEESKPNFTLSKLQPGIQKIEIIAISENAVADYTGTINILESPDLIIQQFDYNPLIDYKKEIELAPLLAVNAPVQNIEIFLDNYSIGKIQQLDSPRAVIMKIKGSGFKYDNYFNLRISFKDKNNKSYSISKDYKITLVNIPWYSKIIRWFRN